mmetsp:Transcript_6975/g.20373  ORF Transcript_6975/g.20373 Transcript_6975/m.20373 type:complete len:328 (-) Transcript_6975:1971-2954(-)
MLLGHLPKFFVESWSNNRGVKPPLLTHTLPSRHPNSASCQASRPSRSSQSSAAFLVKSLAEGPAETQSDIHSERRQTADTSDAENRCGNAVNAPGLHQCRRHIYWKVHCGATTADGGRADAQPSSGKFQVVRLHLQQLEAAHCDAEAPVTAAAAAAEQNPAGVAVIVGRFAPAAAQTAAVPAAAAAAAAGAAATGCADVGCMGYDAVLVRMAGGFVVAAVMRPLQQCGWCPKLLPCPVRHLAIQLVTAHDAADQPYCRCRCRYAAAGSCSATPEYGPVDVAVDDMAAVAPVVSYTTAVRRLAGHHVPHMPAAALPVPVTHCRYRGGR